LTFNLLISGIDQADEAQDHIGQEGEQTGLFELAASKELSSSSTPKATSCLEPSEADSASTRARDRSKERLSTTEEKKPILSL
jgi:hypothetical protein